MNTDILSVTLEPQEGSMRAMPHATHSLKRIDTPISVIVRCSCGWSHTETRHQNALARAAKLRAAIRRHDRERMGVR